MGKTRSARGPTNTEMPAPPGDVDPRVQKLLRALRTDADLGPVIREYEGRTARKGGGRKFGSNGLKASGKLFALFTQGTLVVKLSKSRVLELVDRHVGEPFDPGHGRRMKEWLTVTSARASWVELAREAYEFVSSRGT